jgi:hypothetical protein
MRNDDCKFIFTFRVVSNLFLEHSVCVSPRTHKNMCEKYESEWAMNVAKIYTKCLHYIKKNLAAQDCAYNSI